MKRQKDCFTFARRWRILSMMALLALMISPPALIADTAAQFDVTTFTDDSDMDDPVKTAIVGDLVVEGKVGDDLQGTHSTVITLTGDTFADGFINGNAAPWFLSGLPAGIDVTVFKIDDVTAHLYFSGLPTEVSNDVFNIEIPADLLTSNTPLAVETNPEAKFDIGENVTFDPIRTAVISDVIVVGKVGDDLIGTHSALITLTGDTFTDGFISGNAESWFVPCLPAGIDVTVFKFDDVTARLYFSGLPTETSSDVFNMEIPANLLTSNTPLVVETNPNAKFDIGENATLNPVKSAVIWDVTVSGKVDETLPYYAAIIKLTGDAFKEDEFSSSVDASTWFISGSPAGIEIMAYRIDNETIRLNFSGLPTEASNDVFDIEIPAYLLMGNESVSIETNPDAKFDIGERDTGSDNEDPVGDDPGNNNPGGNNPQGDDPEDNNPGGNNSQGDNPGDNNPGGNNPQDDDPGDNNPGGDNSQDDNPGDNNPDGNNSQGDNPGDNNPGGNEPGDHDPNDLSVNNEHLTAQSLKAYAQNGILYVSGLRQGATLQVFNILGSLIYQGKTYEDKVSIPLPGRGVYIVTDGSHGVKVSN